MVFPDRLSNELHPLLTGYFQQIDTHLPGLLRTFDILGSVALGGFNPRFSDVDVLAELAYPPAAPELAALQTIHRRLAQAFPRRKLEISYIVVENGAVSAGFEAHDGRLRLCEPFAPDPVSEWIFSRQRISLLAETPQLGHQQPSAEDLRAWVRRNQQVYWQPWTTHPLRFVMLLTDWGVQWSVLGILRQWYTLAEGGVITKEGAGAFGLARMDAEWHPLIKEALQLRGGGQACTPRHPVRRAKATVRLLQTVLAACAEIS